MRPVYSDSDREGSQLRNERFGRATARVNGLRVGVDGRMSDPDRATNLPRFNQYLANDSFHRSL